MHICSIELTGAPGSGKTSVERELRRQAGYAHLTDVIAESGDHLRDRFIGPAVRHLPLPAEWVESLVARSSDRHELLTEFLTAHPGILTALEPLISVRRESYSTPLALRWFFSLAYRWQLAERVQPSTPMALAEGFAHRSVSFGDPTRTPNPKVIADYLTSVPEPCILVLLEVDPSVAMKRLQNDGRYVRRRIEHQTEEARQNFYEGLHRSTVLVTDVAEHLGWTVERVRNNNDIDATVSSISTVHRSLNCAAS